MPVVRSFAKINWMLRILGRRADGYHELETLFQSISLHDSISFERSPDLTLHCSDPAVPADDSNLIMRAAKLMAERGAPSYAIELNKRIPAGGGLGGGSSNAATTLRVLAADLGGRIREEELHLLALQLGSDVPFFLVGGLAYATGRGERLIPLPDPAPIPLLLLFPEERVMTADAFRGLAQLREGSGSTGDALGFEKSAGAAGRGFFERSAWLVNDLEEPVFAMLPHLRDLRDRLVSEGAEWSRMTGSGSTIVGAFRDETVRDHATSNLRELVKVVPAETITRERALGG